MNRRAKLLTIFVCIVLLAGLASIECCADKTDAPASGQANTSSQSAPLAEPRKTPFQGSGDEDDSMSGLGAILSGVIDAIERGDITDRDLEKLDFSEIGDPGFDPQSKYSVVGMMNKHIHKSDHGYTGPEVTEIVPHDYLDKYVVPKKGMRIIFNLRRVQMSAPTDKPFDILYSIIPIRDPDECRVIKHTDGTPMGYLQYVASPDFVIAADNHQIVDLPPDWYTQDPNRESRMVTNHVICVHKGNDLYKFVKIMERAGKGN